MGVWMGVLVQVCVCVWDGYAKMALGVFKKKISTQETEHLVLALKRRQKNIVLLLLLLNSDVKTGQNSSPAPNDIIIRQTRTHTHWQNNFKTNFDIKKNNFHQILTHFHWPTIHPPIPFQYTNIICT